jgi:hypothetical protein
MYNMFSVMCSPNLCCGEHTRGGDVYAWVDLDNT